MIIMFYSTTFIIFSLFFLSSPIDLQIQAASTPLHGQQNHEKEQLFLSNNLINISLKDIKNNLSIYGIVDSSFSIPKKGLWIATGNWSMNLKNNTPIFDLSMTWYNNKESIPRTYHIFNFKPLYTEIGLLPTNILLTNGTASISLNNKTALHIPITIDIERNKIMTVYYNDSTINRHFGNQPLYGIVTSMIIKNSSNNNSDKLRPFDNKISQRSVEIPLQNRLSNNGISPNNTNNSPGSIDNYFNNKNKNITTITAPTTTFNSTSIIIPENAGYLGNPSYFPQTMKINKGDKLVAINNDKSYHTLTSISNENISNPQIGKLFDSGNIDPQKTVTVDTTKLNPGIYHFECTIHTFMKGTLIVG